MLNDNLDSLTPKESKILKLRWGLDELKEHTYEEIGSMFNVTKERIRQIEAKALRKLRHPSRSLRLSPFVDPNFKSLSDDVYEPAPEFEAYGDWNEEENNAWHEKICSFGWVVLQTQKKN